ncbi:hypothetical protein JOF37_001561 [Microbacterium imperiale]|nr:hypothetical protein [Microbacterium imperiale]
MQVVLSVYDRFNANVDSFVAAAPTPRAGLIHD